MTIFFRTLATLSVIAVATPLAAQTVIPRVTPSPAPAPFLYPAPWPAPFVHADVLPGLASPPLQELPPAAPSIMITPAPVRVQPNWKAPHGDQQGQRGQQGQLGQQVMLYQRSFGKRDSEERTYQQARSAIEQNQYDRALELLEQVIEAKTGQSDAAMYWKAYSQARIGRRSDALTTLADLQKRFDKSRWLNDARALEVEVKRASGQPVDADALASEELKLLALQSYVHNNIEGALPTIERILTGPSSPRVKDQALFVLSQNRNPKTRSVLLTVAKGAGNPELQLRAIRYLGMMGGSENLEALGDVYRSAPDDEVKRSILGALAAVGDVDRLAAIAKSETNVDLRRMAVLSLASANRQGSTEALLSIYGSAQEPEIKRAVIDGLASHNNGKALVDLARAEKDLELRKAIVARLSHMSSPEARDYMLELLK